MIKAAYTVFIGILLALLVGTGIAAFYHSPKPPSFINFPQAAPAGLNSSQSAQLEENQKNNDVYTQQYQEYNRNVSVVALILAVVLLAASFGFPKKLRLFGDGFILGSVLTLGYSIIRIINSNEDAL